MLLSVAALDRDGRTGDPRPNTVLEPRAGPHLHSPLLASLASRWSFRNNSWYFTFGGTVFNMVRVVRLWRLLKSRSLVPSPTGQGAHHRPALRFVARVTYAPFIRAAQKTSAADTFSAPFRHVDDRHLSLHPIDFRIIQDHRAWGKMPPRSCSA